MSLRSRHYLRGLTASSSTYEERSGRPALFDGERTMDSEMPTDPRHDGPTTMPSHSSGWWETARAALIRPRITDNVEPGAAIVDVGCGRGDMLRSDHFDDYFCVGVDSFVWPEWKRAGGQLFVCAHADALPFRDGAFDVVGSFDVLEHLHDDGQAMAEQARIVTPTGSVITAVPADPRLWSQHDESVGHLRRYTTATATDLIESAGLTVSRTTNFFSFLWLPARLLRHSKARSAESVESDSVANKVASRLVRIVARVERAFLRQRSLPFGSSLLIESRPHRPPDQ